MKELSVVDSMVITFLSDLGLKDITVAGAKAAWMSHVSDAEIVDISHNVAQYDVQQAAYLLLSAYRHFAKGTVHIAAVDVFAGNSPRLAGAYIDGYFFIAPDNGLLPLAFGPKANDAHVCFEFNKPYSFNDWINEAGKVISVIAQNNSIDSYPALALKKATPKQPQVTPNGIDCNILYIDRYGNIVLDINREQFDTLVNDKPFRIRLLRLKDINTISKHYSDVRAGDPLCRFNSAGFLEVAINRENAAMLLGLGTFSTSNIRYQTIKIFL